MDGLLNIYKPRGWTSRRVVDHVVQLAKQRRVGHTGTLDPMAEGVLVVCLGQATRLVELVQQLPKRYRAEFLLGHESDTDDTEGEVRRVDRAAWPALEELEAAIAPMIGSVLQRPPAYSALKVRGERAYHRARRGEAVELPSRPVRIDEIGVVAYEPPRVVLDIACHAGTYIRAIGRDLARSLGTRAVMSKLLRTGVGRFTAEEAVPAESLAQLSDLQAHLLPTATAVEHLPRVELTRFQVAAVTSGQSVDVSRDQPRDVEQIAAFDDQGELVAILVRRDAGWGPRKVLARAAGSS